MRYLSWLLRLVLFLLLFGFAIKNVDQVTLHYYLGYAWEAPLVVILLIFFFAGVLIGLFANLGVIFRHRREIAALKKDLRLKGHAPDDGI